jgi:hypothetical protein
MYIFSKQKQIVSGEPGWDRTNDLLIKSLFSAYLISADIAGFWSILFTFPLLDGRNSSYIVLHRVARRGPNFPLWWDHSGTTKIDQ